MFWTVRKVLTAYPLWVCHECAVEAGGKVPECATFHIDACGVCGEMKAVAEPRDYGYPPFAVETKSAEGKR